jgi:hypothetical protein
VVRLVAPRAGDIALPERLRLLGQLADLQEAQEIVSVSNLEPAAPDLREEPFD